MLGDQLARELTAEQVTEAGANNAAKRTAKRIEELRKQAEASTLVITLRAMGVSKWAQTLAANTVTNGATRFVTSIVPPMPVSITAISHPCSSNASMAQKKVCSK